MDEGYRGQEPDKDEYRQADGIHPGTLVGQLSLSNPIAVTVGIWHNPHDGWA